MKNRNAIFLEEHNFTFSSRKNLNNIVFLLVVFVLFAYMSSPINSRIYYIKNGSMPYTAASTAIVSLFILLVIIIRKVIISLDDSSITPLADWIKRSPLNTGKIVFSYTIFFIWFAFILTVLLLPVLMIGYATSGADITSIVLCTLYIFLCAFFFQLISLFLRGFSENGGAFISLWILVLFILTLLFSILKNASPFTTINSLFDPGSDKFPGLTFMGIQIPLYLQGIAVLLLLILILYGAVLMQLMVKQKEKRFR